jgi:hypothetical protein
MPKKRKDETILPDLEEVQAGAQDLIVAATDWEQGGDDQKLAKLADEIQHKLLLLVQDVAQVGMKF